MKGAEIPHLAKTSTWERLFFSPNPMLPSRKIEGKHRDWQAEKEESRRNGVITDTKNSAGTSGD